MFTYVTPPSVTKVEPAEGSTLGGTSVVITGTGFLEGTKVTIGKAVASLKIESATEIVAKTAAGAAGKDEVVASYANGVVSTGGCVVYVYRAAGGELGLARLKGRLLVARP